MYYWIILLLVGCSGPIRAADNVDLMGAYEFAREADPQLRGAEQALRVAEAQERQALGALLPTVKGFGQTSFNELSQQAGGTFSHPAVYTNTQDYIGHRAGVTIQQVLFQLPAFLDKLRFSSLTEQAQEQYRGASKDLMANVVVRYFDVLAARDVLDLVDAEKATAEKEMRRIKEMYKLQLAKITDLYQIEAHYDALLTEEIADQTKVAVALESLRELTGTPISSVKPLKPDARFPPLEGAVEEWVALAKQNSPILQALVYGVDAAETYIQEQWASHLPTLSMSLNYVYSDTTFDSRQIPTYETKYATVDMSLPFYQGGAVEAKRREAIGRLNIAKETREEKERAIEKATRTAFLNTQASRARMSSTAKLVKSAEKAYDAVEKGYSLGISTIVDVLKAKKDRFEARAEQVAAKYEYVKSYVELKHNTGTVTEADLEEVNRWIVFR